MTRSKRIVCLANSRKLAGRCIAGREWTEGEGAGRWVRPVSEREHQDVSEYERQYADGSEPRVLDIIDIPVLEPQSEGCQTENWLLDPEYYWEKVGSYSSLDLPVLVDPVSPLWLDGYSTYHGRNDRVPTELTGEVRSSLRLIRSRSLRSKFLRPVKRSATRNGACRDTSSIRDREYAFWVTDPRYEKRYLAKLDGSYRIGECCLTISLGEPYKGSFYKLIAAIIEPGRW